MSTTYETTQITIDVEKVMAIFKKFPPQLNRFKHEKNEKFVILEAEFFHRLLRGKRMKIACVKTKPALERGQNGPTIETYRKVTDEIHLVTIKNGKNERSIFRYCTLPKPDRNKTSATVNWLTRS